VLLDPLEHKRLVHDPEPSVQVDGITLTRSGVPDPGDDRCRRVERRHLSLDRFEVELDDPAADRELEQRDPGGDQVADRRLPCLIRRSHGSSPSGWTATNVCEANLWSSSNARSAAFCPAASRRR
jgi:hypothetical protein